MIQPTMTIILRTTTPGYPSSNPGMSRKFIPYQPVIKVSGKKIVEMLCCSGGCHNGDGVIEK